MKCFKCQRDFPNKQSLGGHIASAHPEYKPNKRKREFFTIMEQPILHCTHCDFSVLISTEPMACPLCGKIMETKKLRRTEEIL